MSTQTNTATTSAPVAVQGDEQTSSLFQHQASALALALPMILQFMGLQMQIIEQKQKMQENNITEQCVAARAQAHATKEGAQEAEVASIAGALTSIGMTVAGTAASVYEFAGTKQAHQELTDAQANKNEAVNLKKLSDNRNPVAAGGGAGADGVGVEAQDVQAERARLRTGKSIFDRDGAHANNPRQIEARDRDRTQPGVHSQEEVTQRAINGMSEENYTEFRGNNEANVTRAHEEINAASNKYQTYARTGQNMGEMLKQFGQAANSMAQSIGQAQKAACDADATRAQLLSSLAQQVQQQSGQDLSKATDAGSQEIQAKDKILTAMVQS